MSDAEDTAAEPLAAEQPAVEQPAGSAPPGEQAGPSGAALTGEGQSAPFEDDPVVENAPVVLGGAFAAGVGLALVWRWARG